MKNNKKSELPSIQQLMKEGDLSRQQVLVKLGLSNPLISPRDKDVWKSNRNAVKTAKNSVNNNFIEAIKAFGKYSAPNWGGFIFNGVRI